MKRKRTYTSAQAYAIAHGAGMDAANRSMVKAGRSSWDESDWDEAARVFEAVMGSFEEIAR